MALVRGTRLGPYEIESLLGRGGMGEVYRATDTCLGRRVAIKVLPEELASDERLQGAPRERGEDGVAAPAPAGRTARPLTVPAEG